MLIFLLVSIILLILVFIQYNIITKLKLKVQQSKSTIDVYCQQRFDLIPNLVEVVKNYAKYEENVFKDITKLRTEYNKTKDINIGQDLNNRLNYVLCNLENYPELKAIDLFLDLQKNLKKMESQLQAARRIYNNDVTKYNTKISIFPFNIIAKIFGFNQEILFQTDSTEIESNIETNDL